MWTIFRLEAEHLEMYKPLPPPAPAPSPVAVGEESEREMLQLFEPMAVRTTAEAGKTGKGPLDFFTLQVRPLSSFAGTRAYKKQPGY
jgi:hypothetical protein